MSRLLTTKEVSQFLNINEKMVYTLISEKGLPATKITGKWLFPRHLVEQWVETNTINYPENAAQLPDNQGLLIITGSNDLLLDKLIYHYNTLFPGSIAVFGNLGSMGGLLALRQNLCHIASSHLLQEDEDEYNFEYADKEFGRLPAIVNFCRREQGIVVKKGNPKRISGVADLARKGIRIVNRAGGTGTRLLLERELKKAGIRGDQIDGFDREVDRHLDVGLEVMADGVDAGPCIRTVAGMLKLDFVPLRWERYDLMIAKEQFFDVKVQRFLGLLHEPHFRKMAEALQGYDIDLSGRMLFPQTL